MPSCGLKKNRNLIEVGLRPRHGRIAGSAAQYHENGPSLPSFAMLVDPVFFPTSPFPDTPTMASLPPSLFRTLFISVQRLENLSESERSHARTAIVPRLRAVPCGITVSRESYALLMLRTIFHPFVLMLDGLHYTFYLLELFLRGRGLSPRDLTNGLEIKKALHGRVWTLYRCEVLHDDEVLSLDVFLVDTSDYAGCRIMSHHVSVRSRGVPYSPFPDDCSAF
jgi:hypothetical protein